MRTPFIVGNWKMNKTVAEACKLVSELKELVTEIKNVEIGICPPAINLVPVKEIIEDSNIKLGAQNLHSEKRGAFTGELSGEMLKSVGVDYVIIGHSERRELFAETDQSVNFKVNAAFASDLKPIICVGETLAERKKEATETKVELQVRAALTGLKPKQLKKVVIAYEPIWAIGTGESATAEEANRVIKYIRDVIAADYGRVAEEIRIQYGGSVKPDNTRELMAQKEIDGALVGGASLQAESFGQIVARTAALNKV